MYSIAQDSRVKGLLQGYFMHRRSASASSVQPLSRISLVRPVSEVISCLADGHPIVSIPRVVDVQLLVKVLVRAANPGRTKQGFKRAKSGTNQLPSGRSVSCERRTTSDLIFSCLVCASHKHVTP